MRSLVTADSIAAGNGTVAGPVRCGLALRHVLTSNQGHPVRISLELTENRNKFGQAWNRRLSVHVLPENVRSDSGPEFASRRMLA